MDEMIVIGISVFAFAVILAVLIDYCVLTYQARKAKQQQEMN